MPAGPVQSVDQALADPQVVHRGASAEVDTPGLGRMRIPLSPFVFDGRRRRHTGFPPALGEHTAAVLRRWLDLDDRGLARLAADGAFGGFEP